MFSQNFSFFFLTNSRLFFSAMKKPMMNMNSHHGHKQLAMWHRGDQDDDGVSVDVKRQETWSTQDFDTKSWIFSKREESKIMHCWGNIWNNMSIFASVDIKIMDCKRKDRINQRKQQMAIRKQILGSWSCLQLMIHITILMVICNVFLCGFGVKTFVLDV